MNFEFFRNTKDMTAIYYGVPIGLLEQFRKAMAANGKFYKIRYRGPRFNTKSASSRGCFSKQTTCLKQDAVYFTAYNY